MAAARVANALVGVPDPALETLPEDETVHQLAARLEPHPHPAGAAGAGSPLP